MNKSCHNKISVLHESDQVLREIKSVLMINNNNNNKKDFLYLNHVAYLDIDIDNLKQFLIIDYVIILYLPKNFDADLFNILWNGLLSFY